MRLGLYPLNLMEDAVVGVKNLALALGLLLFPPQPHYLLAL